MLPQTRQARTRGRVVAGTSARRTARVVLLAAMTTIVTGLGATTGAAAAEGGEHPLLPVDVPVTAPVSLDQSVDVPNVTVPTLVPSPTESAPTPTAPPATAVPTTVAVPAPAAPSVAPQAPAVTAPSPPPMVLPVRNAAARPPLTFERMTTRARSQAQEFALPFALVALVVLFLAAQHRLSANDARLSAAPIDDDLRRFR